MVDPVTLWPVRSVSRSLTDEGARMARASASPTPARSFGNNMPKLVNIAADLARAGPPVDYAKIALVRQAIARGEYSKDVEAIANAMVGFFRAGE